MDDVVAGAVPTVYVTLKVKRSYNPSAEEKDQNIFRMLNLKSTPVIEIGM